jgi:hypothetical protein
MQLYNNQTIMKHLIIFLLALLLSQGSFAQITWQKVRIDLKGKDLSQLAAQGIDLTSGMLRKGVFFETDLSDEELKKVKAAGFSYKILIGDVSAYYAERAAESPYTLERNVDEEWPVPAHWELGSMGGFYTLEEVMAELDEMHTLFPDLITARAAISDTNLTHEGRKQWWVKISDNPEMDEDEPEVLFTGLHHAREPMSYQQMIWFMWYLLENYETNPDIKTMVDYSELYFVPVVNPDGLEYNYSTNPGGGGMWRKNRRDNGDGSFGVDPNRNYGYKWGLDDSGSSPVPSDQTYRGPAPFSEPAIANMRDFCNAHHFKIALNYHSYSNLLLYPWGYTPDPPADGGLFDLFARLMTRENHYTTGSANTTIYEVNGDSNDWMYGEQDTKEKIFAYVPEIGGYDDGFWPAPERIVPLCREQMWQNMTAVKLSGKYAFAEDLSPVVISEETGYLHFELTRLGLMQCDTFTVSVQPLDPNLLQVGDPVVFENMSLQEIREDSVWYHITASPDVVTEIKYLLNVDNGMFVTTDTITKYYGTEITVFEDHCNDLNNWDMIGWGLTNEDYFSPYTSITDSPNQDYQNGTNSMIEMKEPVSLDGTPVAFLSFHAKWDIEESYDYAQVMIKSEISGWKPLKGSYTTTGSVNQDEGQPVYDGVQSQWIEEKIPLTDYSGEEIKIWFRLVSDAYVVGDGFYFDDVKISAIGSVTGLDQHTAAHEIFVSEPYPNPASGKVSISYDLKNGRGHYRLISVTGRIVREGALNRKGILTLDAGTLTPGIYFIRFLTEREMTTRKLMVR